MRGFYITRCITAPTPTREVKIRRFAVGLLALAALAAAGLLLSRRRPTLEAVSAAKERQPVDDLYAAGL